MDPRVQTTRALAVSGVSDGHVAHVAHVEICLFSVFIRVLGGCPTCLKTRARCLAHVEWATSLELVALASGIPLWSTLCKLQVQLVNFLPPGPAHDHENLPMNLPPAGTGRRRAYAASAAMGIQVDRATCCDGIRV